MIQRPTGADMPVYASLSTMRQQPTQDEIANGVIPLDTLPANWWNWLWNTITRAQNDLQYNDEVIFTEINNVLTSAGITPNPTADAQATHDQLIRAINIIKNAVATTATLGVVKSSDTGTDGTVRVNTGGTMNVNGFGDLATLHTVGKDTVTGAINEVHDEMDALNTNLTQEIQNEASEIRGEIGTLSSLTTTAKNNLVAAVNEVQSEVNTATSTANTNKTAIGTLSSLTTTAKNNLVAAVNEVQSEVNTATSTANANKTAIGTLSSLTTTVKNNLVAAVNEVQSEVNTATSTANTANSTANTNKTAIGTLSSLTTTAKTNLVSAVNEVQSEVNTATSTANTNKTAIGTLSSLTTTAKTNLVAAVNEVQSEVNTATSTANTANSTANTNKTAIGTLSSLTTTAKTNLVAAVNEVQSDVNGKQDSLVTKTYTMPTLTTAGIRYIKIATCPYTMAPTIHCQLTGGSFIDDVFINLCSGNSKTADSCGWYTTNNKNTQSVIIKRADTYSSSFEVWLKVNQATTLSVRLYVEKSYSGILNTDTSLNITATAPSGSIVEHSLMDNHSGFFGNMPSTNTYRYTFVVDSNAALTAWANNDRSGGKDYTSVLIRKGTWTSSNGVGLTAAGTKVVVGEAGSKLVFSNVDNGLFYGSAPTTADYYMQGVTLELTSGGIGFYKCNNLTNCTATVTGVKKCTGFSVCNNLTNCTATTTSYGESIGFAGCNNLTNCTADSYANDTGNSNGFYNCTYLTNCKGTAAINSGGTGEGLGFIHCRAVNRCKAGGHCSDYVFYACYASSTYTSTYVCADTANGGFNNTTNPA